LLRKIINHVVKGSQQELLPNRHAVNRLTGGETWERTINNYAKVTPSGEDALNAPNVLDMAQVKY
jgi:hypothetical protein